MKVALWTPRPESGWPHAVVPLLRESVGVEVVGEEPRSAPDVDLHVYHIADRSDHAFVYHALLRRPGLVVLEEWSLHRLVHAATAGRGDAAAYRREARRAHGPLGSFCARQVLAGRGGRLPSLLTLNQRVLERASGLVATSRAVYSRAAPRLRGQPLVHLPLGFLGVGAPPSVGDRTERAPGTPVVVVVESRRDERLEGAMTTVRESVRRAVPGATLTDTREEDRDFTAALADADVVVALEDPVRAGLGDAVPLALALGRATLVSAGSGAGQEVPEGVVAQVTPGPTEAAEAAALVRCLLENDSLRSSLGEKAQAFASERADPGPPARALRDLFLALPPLPADGRVSSSAHHAAEDSLAARAVQEIAVAGRELGLPELPSDLVHLVDEVFSQEAR
jgi:hypothetical protein